MKVTIKGIRKSEDEYSRNEYFKIANIKAGITLKDGGCFLCLSSKPLSKAFEEVFKKIKRDKNGFYKKRTV